MTELRGIMVTILVVFAGLCVLIGAIFLFIPTETIPSTPMTVSDSIKAVDLQILELQLEREQFSLDSMRMSEYKNVLFECLASLNRSGRYERMWCEDRAEEFTGYNR